MKKKDGRPTGDGAIANNGAASRPSRRRARAARAAAQAARAAAQLTLAGRDHQCAGATPKTARRSAFHEESGSTTKQQQLDRHLERRHQRRLVKPHTRAGHQDVQHRRLVPVARRFATSAMHGHRHHVHGERVPCAAAPSGVRRRRRGSRPVTASARRTAATPVAAVGWSVACTEMACVDPTPRPSA